MDIISLISFIVCIIIVLLSLKSNIDLLSPARVFIFVWAIVLGITNLKLSRLQFDWTTEIWIQILIGPAAFLTGVFIIYIINFGKKVYDLSSLRKLKTLSKLDTTKLFKIVLLLYSLFIISYLILYFKVGNIPVLAAKPWLARRDFTMFGIGLFMHNVFLIVILTVIYFLLEKKNKKKRIVLLIGTFTSVLLYSATLQRYQIILSIFSVLLLLYYKSNKINYKSIVGIGFLVIGFFYLISSFRLGELVLFIIYKISKMKFSPHYAVFTEPYMYISMNLENYAHGIKKLNDFSYGFYTFDFLTALSGLKHWMQEYFHLVQNPYLISINFNTYTAFWAYYRDFGILGIFFIPFLAGILISNLYYSFKKIPSIKKLAFYSMFLYVVIFSFFNSAASFLWFFYDAIVLVIIFKSVEAKVRINNKLVNMQYEGYIKS